MARSDLHIVTFAVPYPPHYGGAIDVWNRILALKECGVSIHLHCFVYGVFDPHPILREVAAQVSYYPRVVWPALLSKGQPYIVSSRRSPELLRNLSKDHVPVLFEGIHTTGFLSALKDRKLLLRAHNIEYQYYDELARFSKGVKSLIYQRESLCLKEYEVQNARKFDMVFPISPHDADWFAGLGVQTSLWSPFHGIAKMNVQPGRGHYILYQGDLSIGINQEALLDMLERLPEGEGLPVVVAGRAGNAAFESKLSRYANLTREADVSQEKMIDLIRNAHMIMIHSLHGSGMKLKIFPALYHGRFVAATENCRTDTGLDQMIDFYTPAQTLPMIKSLWDQEFTQTHIQQRSEILDDQPSDRQKAEQILQYL